METGGEFQFEQEICNGKISSKLKGEFLFVSTTYTYTEAID